MELVGFASKNIKKIVNIAIIILALIISSNIYKQQAKEIESLKIKNDLEAKKNAVIESIGKQEKTINAYRNLLIKKDAGSVINIISNIAKDSEVKIASIRPGQEQRFPDYINMPFSLTLSAPNYHALGNFISRLESYKDVYMVEVIEIKSESQSKELTISLTVSSIAFTPSEK